MEYTCDFPECGAVSNPVRGMKWLSWLTCIGPCSISLHYWKERRTQYFSVSLHLLVFPVDIWCVTRAGNKSAAKTKNKTDNNAKETKWHTVRKHERFQMIESHNKLHRQGRRILVWAFSHLHIAVWHLTNGIFFLSKIQFFKCTVNLFIFSIKQSKFYSCKNH